MGNSKRKIDLKIERKFQKIDSRVLGVTSRRLTPETLGLKSFSTKPYDFKSDFKAI